VYQGEVRANVMDEVYLRIEPRLFGLLKKVFDTVATDAYIPIDDSVIEDARGALHTANINAMPGLPVVVNMTRDTPGAISCCFEVGGESASDISDDDYEAIQAVVEQAGYVE
jgi:hypothetical protein